MMSRGIWLNFLILGDPVSKTGVGFKMPDLKLSNANLEEKSFDEIINKN